MLPSLLRSFFSSCSTCTQREERRKEGRKAYYSYATEKDKREREREALISLLILAPSSVTAAAACTGHGEGGGGGKGRTAAGEGRAVVGKKDSNGRGREGGGGSGGAEAVFRGQLEERRGMEREGGREAIRSFTCARSLSPLACCRLSLSLSLSSSVRPRRSEED